LLGQIEGDLVMGVFVPGLAGGRYRRKAVEGGSRLLRVVDWLEVGVGIASARSSLGMSVAAGSRTSLRWAT
jgi:hypothetical protein